MKRTDIKAGGWYAYVRSPRSSYRGNPIKVYVFGEVNVRYLNSWADEVTDPDADPSEYREYRSPFTPNSDNSPVRIPEHLFRANYPAKRGWLVAHRVTNVTRYRYLTDDDGNDLTDEAGNWIEEAYTLPDYWQFGVVKSENLIKTWIDHEWAEIARKKRELDQAQQRAAERAALVAEREAKRDLIASYGVDLAEVCPTHYDLKRWLGGVGDWKVTYMVDAILATARTAYVKGKTEHPYPGLYPQQGEPSEPVFYAV